MLSRVSQNTSGRVTVKAGAQTMNNRGFRQLGTGSSSLSLGDGVIPWRISVIKTVPCSLC